MRISALALALMVFAVGCGGAGAPRAYRESDKAAPGGDPAAPPAAGEARAKPEANDPGQGQPLDRRIIYNGFFDLVVESIEKADRELRQLVAQQKGAYVAKAEIRGAPGSPRQGSWTLRVPAGQFDGVRQALLQLGEVQRDSLDSQDITEQFYDLEARIKNNLARAESLRKLLEKAAQTNDYLAVQQKLDQVTAELDVQKGQLLRLDKLSTLATLTVTMQERRGFVPQEALGFGTRIGRAFGDSLAALRGFGEALAIVGAALAPWLPLIAVVAACCWWLLRRQARPMARRSPPPAITPPAEAPPSA